MTSLAEVRGYRTSVDGLTLAMVTELELFLSQFDLSTVDPATLRQALIEYLPGIIGPYADAADVLASGWFQEVVEAGGIRATVVQSPDLAPARVEALSRWVVRPLTEQSNSTVLSLLAGAAQRIVADAGRDVIRESVTATNASYGRRVTLFARVPQPGCCAFCAMLASRGFVYSSESAAGSVTGRGVDASVTAGRRGGQGRGVRARGVAQLGDSYHDFCRCVVTPSTDRDPWMRDLIQEYQDMYYMALTNKDSTPGRSGLVFGNAVVDTEATLAEMRRQQGIR